MLKYSCLAAVIALGALSSLRCPGAVVINEIMANNQTAVRNDGGYPDWVEILNTGPGTVNLLGYTLTDNLTQTAKFTINSSTPLGPGQSVLVWCDASTSQDGIHASFSLRNGGEEVGIYDNLGRPLDSVRFGLQPADFTLSRIPDGAGPWTLSLPTPLAANEAQALGDARRIAINEWMASPASGDDWIELYNPEPFPVAIGGFHLSDATVTPSTNRPLHALSFLAPEGFVQVFASGLSETDPDHLDFRLSNGGETLSIYDTDGRTVIHQIGFARQEANVSQGRLPDGAATLASFPVGRPTPAASNFIPIPNVLINEVLTHTDFPYEDAVELYNPTQLPVNVGYWWLSNSRSDVRKYRFPANTIIQPLSYLVVYEYQIDPDRTGNGASFRFNSSRGDECYLYSADASGNLLGGIVSVELPPAENQISWGRVSTSQGARFVPLERMSFGVDQPGNLPQFRSGQGLPNAGPRIGPLVLSEIMYHPPSLVVDVDNTADEYVELRNLLSTQLPLFHPLSPLTLASNAWRLDGAVEYVFPTSTVLEPREAVLIVGFDPAADALRTAGFRARFGVPQATRLFGPFSGKLGNGGASLELYKPDEIQRPPRPDAGLIPMILVERIDYDDAAPWPAEPDGTGAALHRRNDGAFGNDPVNWLAAAPTPGLGISPQAAPVFTDISRSGQTITLRFFPEPGVAYSLEYVTSLESQEWIPLPARVVGTDPHAEATFQDELNPQDRTRYYRLRAPAD